VRIDLAAARGERERAAAQHVDRAFFDEVEQDLAELRVLVLACTELVGERGQLDAWRDQAGQGVDDSLPIERRHWVLSI
jgi:hypothetical protein